MIKTLKSWYILLVIYLQKIVDHTHRFIFGIPTLKRSQITSHLYLGGQYNLQGLGRLKQLGITAIVNLRTSVVLREGYFRGFKYLHLPTAINTPPTMADLIRGARFTEDEIRRGGKVYIHCRQGHGRGPSMAIAYLLKIGLTFDDAYNLVKKVRTFIQPTKNQIIRLQELERYYNKIQIKATTKPPTYMQNHLRSKIKLNT